MKLNTTHAKTAVCCLLFILLLAMAQLTAAQEPIATLRAPQEQPVLEGATTDVELVLETADLDIAAVAFVLHVDPQLVQLDATDGDSDGVPDSVVVHAPANMARSVTWEAATGKLNVALFGLFPPLPTLQDGVLLTVTFKVAADAAVGAAHHAENGRLPLLLEQVSLGDTEGNDVPANAVDGSLLIREPAVKIALPVIKRS